MRFIIKMNLARENPHWEHHERTHDNLGLLILYSIF